MKESAAPEDGLFRYGEDYSLISILHILENVR